MAHVHPAPVPAENLDLAQLEPSPRLHFALLTQTEQASFEAGLRTRLWNRLFDAVTRPTAREYARARAQHVQMYLHLVEVLREEAGHGAEPVTDEHLTRLLDQVESDLGDSWRHKLEHAINTSRSAQRIMARVYEGERPPDLDPDRALAWIARWAGAWLKLNWSVDCVTLSTDPDVTATPEVVAATFADLQASARDVYAVACDVHDAIVGDPDEEP